MSNQKIEAFSWGKYFHQLPNIADEELDPYQYRLFGHYIRVAGSGGCWETVKTTAQKCKMSDKKVTSTRQELANMGYIIIKREGDNRHTYKISINEQLISRNIERFSEDYYTPDDNQHRKSTTQHRKSTTQHRKSTTQHRKSTNEEELTKEEPIKEEPLKKKKDIAAKISKNSDTSTSEQNIDSEESETCGKVEGKKEQLNDLTLTSVPSQSDDDLFNYDLINWMRGKSPKLGKPRIRKLDGQFRKPRNFGLDKECSVLDMYERDVVFRNWCDHRYHEIHQHYKDNRPVKFEQVVEMITDAQSFIAWQASRRSAIEFANDDYDLGDDMDPYTQELLLP